GELEGDPGGGDVAELVEVERAARRGLDRDARPRVGHAAGAATVGRAVRRLGAADRVLDAAAGAGAELAHVGAVGEHALAAGAAGIDHEVDGGTGHRGSSATRTVKKPSS